jgi:hypothetical protein
MPAEHEKRKNVARASHSLKNREQESEPHSDVTDKPKRGKQPVSARTPPKLPEPDENGGQLPRKARR